MEETLGKRIVKHRKQLALTQDQLAERLGVTAQAVSKWENDLSCPDIATLPRLAAIFGISVDSLLGCTPPVTEKVHETEVISHLDEADELESEGLRYQNGKWEFRYDGGKRSSIGIALWVILVGVIMIISVQTNLELSLWEALWPTGLLIFGLFGLYPKFSVLRLCCAICGEYFLLENMGLTAHAASGRLVLPICLLLFGLGLLIDALRKPKAPVFFFKHNGQNIRHRSCCDTGEESFECSTSFGENTYFIDLPRLSHGHAEVNFGDLNIDLSGVEEIAERCRIEAKCNFGVLTLLVPRQWKVESDSHTAFGALDFEGQPDPVPKGVLTLLGNVSFGAISVKYI